MNSTRNNALDMNGLVARAKQGDNNAVADLYQLTYDKVFYTVKSMIRDEDTVFDVVQDSYMKAFSHLDSFQGGEKFPAWMKMIAANTAHDWLKKQRPMLFSQLNTDEDMDEPAEAQFVDGRNENLPEWVIEQEETKRLLREILDSLPEDQRAVIGMYYYEELSVKEIAAAMGCTESAVKSRLMYGRKKVEKEVRELEKKGTRLYGLSGIPFLLWLFRSQDAYAAQRPDGRALEQILQSAGRTARGGTGTGAGSGVMQAAQGAGSMTAQTAQKIGAGAAAGAAAAGGAAAGTAAAGAAAGLGGLKLGLIIAAAVAVLGGSVFGIVKAVNKSEPVPAVITSYRGDGERLTDAAKVESGSPTKPVQPQTRAPESPAETAAETTPETTESPEQAAEDGSGSGDAGTTGAGNGPQAMTLPSDGNRIVFSGTIRKVSYEEVIELQGYADPNAEWTDHNQTFCLLFLDEPQEMALTPGDSTGREPLEPRTVEYFSIGEGYLKYDGEHHVFSIDPNNTYWPSDTSLPLGAPRTGDVHILG